MLVANLSGVNMFTAVYLHLPAFHDKLRGQRNRPNVVDLHPASQGDHIAQLVDLAHSLVKDRGDDAAVGMPRRADKALLQPEVANKALALLVEDKLHPQPRFVAGAATEAVVDGLLLVNLMAVNSFVLGHVLKMRQRRIGCKWRVVSSQ